MKLRTKLILIMTIFVISVFAIVYLITMQISKNRAIENINNHINTVVKFKANAIESMLKDYKDITELLAVGVPVIQYSDTTIDHKIRENNLETRISNTIEAYHLITRIRILDAKGIVAASSHEDIGMDRSNRKVFLEGKKGTYIGDLHFSEFTGEYVLSISAPIYANGKISGILIINFAAVKQLFPIIADKTGLVHSTEIYLLNKDHYLISPTLYGDKLLEKKIEPEQISLCYSDHIENKIPEMDLKKLMPYINYRGEKVLGTHSYIPLLKWFLILEMNEAEFMRPVIKYRNILLITFSIILILTLGVSYIISIFLTNPIKRLEASVQEIINGNMDYKVAMKSKDEIGQLSRVFDDMITKLNKSKRELETHAGNLEELVKDRTKELNKQFEKSEQQRIGTLNVLNDLENINVNLKAEITERKKAEGEARKMHQSLVEAYGKLQRAYEGEKQLRDKLIQSEKLASLGQMGAKIAHEINNPLTVISGRVQLYLMEDLDERLKKTFELIIRESKRIENITSAYRNLSRPVLPKQELLDLNAVLEESVENLINTGEIKHYKIQRNLYPDLPQVIGDSNRLIQVFRNLIVNASHAMADCEEKTLTLSSSVSKDGKFAEISIQDTGSGIEKEKLAKIFEVYYTTKADELGTGLGLVVVKDIVEQQHKGKVLVESELGKGTTFTIQLPLKTKRKRKKILIADDEAYIREFYMTFFEDKGLEVFTAPNGKEALDNYEKIQPDIVLSDIEMPVMNGFELVKEIKLKKPDQSIVLMTGLYYEDSVKEQLKKANIPYFTKPADLNDIWKIVSEELKKSS